MKKVVIAFTNSSKLLNVNYQVDELNNFFSSSDLDLTNPFIIVKDHEFSFQNEIPQSLDGIGAIICFDDRNENVNYTAKVKSLFDALAASAVEKVQIVHHSNQSEGILKLIKSISGKFEPIPGAHVTGNLKYKKVIDILVGINIEGNLAVIEEATKNLGIDDELEAKLELLHKCLTPEGAKIARENIQDFELIQKQVEAIKINVLENGENAEKNVMDYLALQTDCFDEEKYLKPLRKLRDTLLQEY